jgi:protein O-GlcNAc transferase
VPILTRIGPTFTGRVAEPPHSCWSARADNAIRLLNMKQMTEKFAAAPEVLLKIREKLMRNRDSCALFDTVRMTRNLDIKM